MVTPTAIMGFQNVDTAIRSKVSLYLSLCVPCKASLGAGGAQINSSLIVFPREESSVSTSQSGGATAALWTGKLIMWHCLA